MNIQDFFHQDNDNTIIMVTTDQLLAFAEALLRKRDEEYEKQQEQEKLYTPKEFADLHHCDKSTLWRWCRDGVLKRTIIGGKCFYKESDLIKK